MSIRLHARRGIVLGLLTLSSACGRPGFGDIPSVTRVRAAPTPRIAFQLPGRARADARLYAVAMTETLRRVPGVTLLPPLIAAVDDGAGPWMGYRAYSRRGLTHVIVVAIEPDGDRRRVTVSAQTPLGDSLWTSSRELSTGGHQLLVSAADSASALASRLFGRATAAPAPSFWPADDEYGALRRALVNPRSSAAKARLSALARDARSPFTRAVTAAVRGREVPKTPLGQYLLRAAEEDAADRRLGRRLRAGLQGAKPGAAGMDAAAAWVDHLDRFEPDMNPWRTAMRRLIEVGSVPTVPPASRLYHRRLPEMSDGAVIAAIDADAALLGAVDAGGFTLLHDAAERGLERRAASLLERGAAVQPRDHFGQVPLHRAAWRGHERMVAGLLAAGAAVDPRDIHAYTPLHRAAWRGRGRTVGRLLAAGARVDARTDLLETPLIVAAMAGQAEVIPDLLDAGARQDAATGRNQTALALAAQRRHTEVVDALIAHPRKPSPRHIFEVALELPVGTHPRILGRLAGALGADPLRDELLWRIAAVGALADIQALLAAGADPVVERDETYPIERAAGRKNAPVVRALAPFGRERTPAPADLALLRAVDKGWSQGIDLLVELGARRTAVSRQGEPAAVLAARRLRGAAGGGVIAQLARHGVDLSARDARGLTALHHAAGRQRALVDALLDAGVDPNIAAADGARPFWFAARSGRRRIAKRLVDAGAVPGLHAAVWYGDGALLKRALGQARGRVSALDRRGWSPLHWAVSRDDLESVKLLLRRGADPNIGSRLQGNTPLHYAAAEHGRSALFALLKRAGGDGAVKNRHGITPDQLRRSVTKGRRARAKRARARKAAAARSKMSAGEARARRRAEEERQADAKAPAAPPAGRVGASTSGSAFRRRSADFDLIALEQARAPLDDVGYIDPESSAARALLSRGHYRAAERIYRDLLARLARAGELDDLRRHAALNNLGRVLTHRGALSEATEVLTRALAGFERALSPGRAAPRRWHLPGSRDRRSMRRWAATRRQRRRRQRRRRPRLQATVAIANLAHVKAIEGKTGPAIEGFQQALTRRLALRRSAWAAAAREALALALMEAGRYRDAEKHLTKALKVFVKRSPEHAVATRLNLGVLRRFVGDTSGAMRAFDLSVRQASTSARRRTQPGLLPAALLNRAELHLSNGERERASRGYGRALGALAEGFGSEHDLVPAALLGLAEAADSPADKRRALARARAAVVRLVGADHPLMASVMVGEAGLEADDEDAIGLLGDAVVHAEAGGWIGLKWSTRVALAERLAKVGRRRSAIFMLKQAVGVLEALRGSTAVRWRERFVEDKSPVYRQLASLLVDDGRLAEAQQTLRLLKREEQARFTLRAGASADRAPPLRSAERQAEAVFGDLRGKIAAYASERARLRRARSQGGLSDAQRDRVKELRDSLRVARRAFARRLDGLEGELKAQGRENRSLRSLRSLQGTLAKLDKEAVAIHYLVTDERVHILLTSSEVQLAVASATTRLELRRKVHALRGAISDPDSEPKRAAKALYDVLIKPIEGDLKKLGAKTLLIAADDVLRYVSFAALHDGRRYLVEGFRPVLFSEAARDKLSPANQGSPTKVAGLGVSAKLGNFSALPSVPKELHGIVLSGDQDPDGVLPGVVKLDKAFHVEALREALDKEFGVIHLATHFELRPGTVKNSFLLLGDGSHLTLETIKYDDFDFRDVDLLTLSACNTGAGLSAKGNDGREVEGFAALAQNLGARSVLATLWPVADESTGLFMQNFYRIRAASPEIGKAEAMRRVQVRLLRGALKSVEQPDLDKPFAHPFFWAPFVLLGNWL